MIHIRLTESEDELLVSLAEKLASSKAEVLRRAMHAYSGVLSVVWKK